MFILPIRQRGLTTVEYAMAGGLVAVSLVVAFVVLGAAVGDSIMDMVNAMGSV